MELTIIPRLSEKTIAQAAGSMYVFNVPAAATKQQVADAVTKQYGVTVVSVNTILAKGKTKRTWRKNGASTKGVRSDVKKAYVRLAQGDTIAAFTPEDASKEAK